MSSYWDRPGRRITSNSSNLDQPADLPPNPDMTVSPSPGGGGGGNGPPATPAHVEQFAIDPFAADINPGTTRGQKLFTEACTPLEEAKKLTASVANQITIIQHIENLIQKFRWGHQVLAVRTKADLTRTKNTLHENHQLKLDDFKLQAYKIWGGGNELDTSIPVNSVTGKVDLILFEINVTMSSTNEEKSVFFDRVRSTMIRRTIEGHFDHKTMKTICLQREEYEWKDPKTGKVEEDGATMLKILFNILKPSLRVGLKEYKKIIQKATFSTSPEITLRTIYYDPTNPVISPHTGYYHRHGQIRSRRPLRPRWKEYKPLL